MGENGKRRVLDMLLLQLAVMDGEITSDEAVDLYMDKWFQGTREPESHYVGMGIAQWYD